MTIVKDELLAPFDLILLKLEPNPPDTLGLFENQANRLCPSGGCFPSGSGVSGKGFFIRVLGLFRGQFHLGDSVEIEPRFRQTAFGNYLRADHSFVHTDQTYCSTRMLPRILWGCVAIRPARSAIVSRVLAEIT